MSQAADPVPPPPADPPGTPPRRPRRPMPLLVLAGLLLTAGIVFPLLVWTYAQDGPRLFGFPFFYWYQLMWVFIAAILTWIAYVIIEGRDRS